MYYDLVLYSEPQRPMINPKFDLFAWLTDPAEPALIFPAKIVTRLQMMLPEKLVTNEINDDMWEFIQWQTEQRGFFVVRSIDHDWFYWAIQAEKFKLLEMERLFLT